LTDKLPPSEIRQWLMVLSIGVLALSFVIPLYQFLDADDFFYRKLEFSIYLMLLGMVFGVIRLLYLVWHARSKDQ
jgi:uncharacterized membrane protein